MFSGIIDRLGRLDAVAAEGAARRLTISTGFTDLALGESLAVNGVCLTVVRHDADGRADVFVSPETLDRSTLSTSVVADRLNLERAVTLATRLSGHLVQGHVDGKARLETLIDDAGSRRLQLNLPKALHPFCVEKGSIALDGVSLTLNGVEPPEGERFAAWLTLIPHTLTHTNLQHLTPGDEMNVEVDVMAKYVERLCQAYLTPSAA